MTLNELLAYVSDLKPHPYSDSVICSFVSEIEGKIKSDLPGYTGQALTKQNNGNDELYVKEPYSKLYPLYIFARIDFQSGNYEDYSASSALFNSFWQEYRSSVSRPNKNRVILF